MSPGAWPLLARGTCGPARTSALLRAAALVWSSLPGLSGCAPGEPDRPPPSVILISIDTLRWDHTGLAGYRRDTTPYLRRLAEESLVFDRAYTTDSWTLTAHMSMLTGLYPEQHQVWDRAAALPAEVSTLAERLGAEGYHTVGLYFPAWIHARFGFARGFDRFQAHFNTRQAQRHLAQAMAERPMDRPLFLFLHLFDVHSTNEKRADIPLYNPPVSYAEHFLQGSLELVAGLDKEEPWSRDGSSVTPEQHQALVALYDDCIRYLDARLEEWIEGWREEGLLDSTLLVITADHGESLHQRGKRYGGHGGFFEEGLRVPLLIRFPDGWRGGERVQAPVSLVDLRPTLEEYLGLEPDLALPGRSLLEPPPPQRTLFAQRRGHETLIQWPHKLTWSPDDPQGLVSLWDLSHDPAQLEGRHRKGQRARQEFAEHLSRAARQKEGWLFPESQRQPEAAPELDRRLRELGYGGELDVEGEH